MSSHTNNPSSNEPRADDMEASTDIFQLTACASGEPKEESAEEIEE
jgi:hypothetical protein